jgi:hypothetical protein
VNGFRIRPIRVVMAHRDELANVDAQLGNDYQYKQQYCR